MKDMQDILVYYKRIGSYKNPLQAFPVNNLPRKVTWGDRPILSGMEKA